VGRDLIICGFLFENIDSKSGFLAGKFQNNELCTELVKRGHEVTVITGKQIIPRVNFIKATGCSLILKIIIMARQFIVSYNSKK